LVIVHSVRHRVLRIALSMPVVIDYQIPREPHQPVRQIALFGVVLIERAVDADENFLSQVFGGIGVGCKTVREIEYPSGKRLNDLLPRHAVARSRSSYEVCTVRCHCSF
jgi:hypothetical protein